MQATMKRILKVVSEVLVSVGSGPTDINVNPSSLQRDMSSFVIEASPFFLQYQK